MNLAKTKFGKKTFQTAFSEAKRISKREPRTVVDGPEQSMIHKSRLTPNRPKRSWAYVVPQCNESPIDSGEEEETCLVIVPKEVDKNPVA